jgi:plastocyanin
MNKALLKIVAAVFVGYSWLAASGWAADNTQQATGTIKGDITVSGVKSPENVLIYIEKVAGDWPPPEKQAEMDQVKLVFIPHVLPIIKGTTVRFLNSDPILHNVFWPKGDSYAARNLGTWGKGASKEATFDKVGNVVLLCNVHPEMEGHIMVLQNPFYALVGEKGAYEIKGVPPGSYTVKAWYPNPKKLKSKTATVTVTAGQATQLDFSLSRK